MFTPVASSPGPFGFQISFRNSFEVGSMREAGIWFPANGCRVTTFVAVSVCVVEGSKMVRWAPALVMNVSSVQVRPARQNNAGTFFVHACCGKKTENRIGKPISLEGWL